MGSRKKQLTVSFTTTTPMPIVTEIIGKLYEHGSVQNLTVDEVPKEAK